MTLNKDQIGGLIFLCLSLTYGYHAGQIDMLPGDEFEPFNARSLPFALATLGALVSALLLTTSSLSSARDNSPLSLAGFDLALTGKMLGLIVLFGLALHWIGFLLATALFLLAGYWLLGERRPKMLLLASVPFAIGIWFILTQLLDIYLAPGQLFTQFMGA